MKIEAGLGKFKIIKVGLNTRHMAGTVVNAPQGSTHSVLMQFCTPARVNTERGIVTADSGDCMIHTPLFPRIFSARDESSEFANNGLFFSCEGLDTMLQAYGLKPNMLLHDLDPVEIMRCFQTLLSESIQTFSYSQRKCELIFEQMLLHLGREDVIHAKIECAKNKLVYQNEPLHTIAQESEFHNEFYFSKIFKKHTGLTAGEFRERANKG